LAIDTARASSPLHWSCSHFAGLLRRSWEDEVFVFNPRTGHTHILNEQSWQLLSACADSPHSETQLFDLVAAESGSSPEETHTSVRMHIDHLQQLDLIQAVLEHASH